MAKKKEKDFPRPSKLDYRTIICPVHTEKAASSGNVVFKVDKKASKPRIKSAIESIFKVEVDKVRTCNYVGKVKRVNRAIGKTAGYKKAYVNLKPGYRIEVVEGL